MEKLRILFVTMSDVGSTHSIIGLAVALRKKGHEVFIATERSWEGKFEKFGLTEKVFDERDISSNSLKDYSNMICSMIEAMKKDPMELCLAADSFSPLFAETAKISSPQIKQIIECVKPNVIVENSLVMVPAVVTSNIPLVRVFTTQPLYGLDNIKLPPAFLGLPTHDDKDWSRLRENKSSMISKYALQYELLKSENKIAGDRVLTGEIHSKNLNIYIYPKAAMRDYLKLCPLDDTWVGLDYSQRPCSKKFEIPEKLKNRNGKLILFSLGSVGSSIVELMKRFIDMLSKSPHRFIVSKGINHEQFELADNMWGEAFLPQIDILPHVDLVITHGGNNSFLETLYFGKPMIVIPLFADQPDNAQRAVELNVGRKFMPFAVSENELNESIENVLSDKTILENVFRISKEMRESNSMDICVQRIEQVAKHPMFPTI